jgi:hypothetical protein
MSGSFLNFFLFLFLFLRVIVDNNVCQVLGWVMYFAGNMGTYLLVAISVERLVF